MSRVIRAATRVRAPARARLLTVGAETLQAGGTGQTETEQGGDGYLERVAKFVPAEVVGFFLFVNNILQQSDKPDHSGTMVGISVHTISIWAFLIGLILTPVYIWYIHEDDDAWKLNAFVSTLAFPIWAYAIGAVAFDKFHDGNFASILLATFTVFSGLLKPPAKSDQDANDTTGGQHGGPTPKPAPPTVPTGAATTGAPVTSAMPTVRPQSGPAQS
jgi:hypothetical protein